MVAPACRTRLIKSDPPLISGLPEISNLKAQVGYSRLGRGDWPGGSYRSARGWTGAGADRSRQKRSVGDDVADLHGAQVAPAVVTADVATFGVAGRVGIAGRCGSADQRAGDKSGADAPAVMAEMRASLGLAADGGESGGEGERGKRRDDGLGLGHGGLHTVELERPSWPRDHGSRGLPKRFKPS